MTTFDKLLVGCSAGMVVGVLFVIVLFKSTVELVGVGLIAGLAVTGGLIALGVIRRDNE